MKDKLYFRIANERGLRYTAEVSVELREGKQKQPVFSASVSVGNGYRFLMGGQCFDEIVKNYTFVNPERKALFMEIYDLWMRNHLNDRNAGTPKQIEALKNGFDNWCGERGINPSNDRYTNQCEYLRSIDLYADKEYLVNEKPYRYGTSWIYRPISENDLKRINALWWKYSRGDKYRSDKYLNSR